MKTDIFIALFVGAVIILCLLAARIARLREELDFHQAMNKQWEKSYTDLVRDNLSWEQRWRDCQAALSMLRTPHAADAVSDVTR